MMVNKLNYRSGVYTVVTFTLYTAGLMVLSNKSELMLMRWCTTASTDSGATLGISVQRAIVMHFWMKGYPNLVPLYGGLLEPRGSKLRLLKSTFSAENFVLRLSWSVSSDFGAIHSWNMRCTWKREKCTRTPYFGIQCRCWYPRKARQQCLSW